MTRINNGSPRAETAEAERSHKGDEGPNEIFTFTDLDLSAAEDYVRRKPQNSLLIAFGVGFLASILLRRK